MRVEKVKELESYIEELKSIKMDLVDRKSRFLEIESYDCHLNNGRVIPREKVIKGKGNGNACIILPVTEDGNVLLVVQPRVFTKSTVGVELPAGYVDEGEDYEAAARRELFEETGYVPKKMINVGSFYQDQGCMSAFNQCFLAYDCKKVGEQHLDKDEIIKYFECSFDEVFELIENGFICDVGSQFTIERAKNYIIK